MSTNVTPIIYMPELMMQKIIEMCIWDLQQHPEKLDYIFNTYKLDEFTLYGDGYIQEVKDWFTSIDLPVIQSWSFNPDRIPCISVHLNSEVEDIDKAAVNDYWGNDDTTRIGMSAFNVSLTLGIHASKNGNYVLWLYYILHHIFFTYKAFIEKMGFQLHTFTGGDYIHDQKYMANNIWSRWINFNCTIQNCWESANETEYSVILKTYIESASYLNKQLANMGSTIIDGTIHTIDYGYNTGAGTGVVSTVTATLPLTSSSGSTPNISTLIHTNKLIGRGSAGSGVVEEITLGSNLSLSGTTLNSTYSGAVLLAGASNGQTVATGALCLNQGTVIFNNTTTTVDWSTGNNQYLIMTGNIGTRLEFTNPPAPCHMTLKIKQGGSGSYTITAWDTDVRWPDDVVPTLATIVNKINVFCFYFDGSNYIGCMQSGAYQI